ncbi:MAG: TIGR02466 family protein [Reyranellaceae bacterium]
MTSTSAASVDDQLFVSLGNDLTLLFATPLLRRHMPDAAAINPGLRAAILARAAAEPGVRISNKGGWQSKTDLLDWPLAEIATLKGWIVEAVRAMAALSPELRGRAPGASVFKAYGWANVNRTHDYNLLHIHPDSHWSGVYYVEAGNPSAGGSIQFTDPRPMARAMPVPGFNFDRALTVTPASGLMLLFPSWLEHWVMPYDGSQERISIAFNCTLR